MGLLEPASRAGGTRGKKAQVGDGLMHQPAPYRPTTIYIAADHGGFAVKERLIADLATDYTVKDLGPEALQSGDDYVPYAKAVGQAVAAETGSMGILVCRSGEGMVMAANKIDGVRAALVWDRAIAGETRRDNDSNVLSLPADHADYHELLAITQLWLTTPFSGAERHARRINEMTKLEGGEA